MSKTSIWGRFDKGITDINDRGDGHDTPHRAILKSEAAPQNTVSFMAQAVGRHFHLTRAGQGLEGDSHNFLTRLLSDFGLWLTATLGGQWILFHRGLINRRAFSYYIHFVFIRHRT